MDTSSKQIKANDVAIILRPVMDDKANWDGSFEIVIGAYGPMTISDDDLKHLVSVATMMSATVSLMEEDEELVERIYKRCEEIYSDDDPDYVAKDKDDIVLDEDTPTYGRMC